MSSFAAFAAKALDVAVVALILTAFT